MEQPVEILVDPWGISHIYAETEHDLFFAQGYNAARDRLFQFEVWRRQATGTWAEVLGPRETKRDIAARLFRFRGDMEEEFAHYHPRGAEIIKAFVAGVNARIAEVRSNPDLLPVELKLLGIEPGEWSPEILISRHQALAYNVTQELEIARALLASGETAVREMYWFQNADPRLQLDDAIDPNLLAADLLELYRIYKSPVSFQPEDIVANIRADASTWQRLAENPPPGEAELIRRGEAIGSNNWALSGAKTTTGRPILANDPHRLLQAPSLRYFAHLVGPGWNVLGGGEPVLPGISIGHNGHGAWGLTVFRIDNEDLYIYETDTENRRYRYGNGWEEFVSVEERIDVRDQAPVTVELKFTRHGPVIYEDPETQAAVALRAAWLEPGGAPYLASLRMNQAQTWEEFRDACSFNHMPGENMLWADADGNIGWQATGLAPLRPNWSGLLPVPGDGRYEWNGYLPIKELPHEANPARKFLATANENLVPPDYPNPEVASLLWPDPFRGHRLHEVLNSGRKFGIADSMQLQHDLLSLPARTLVPLLRPLQSEDAPTEEARRLLLDWNFTMNAESAPAAIYNAWHTRLMEGAREWIVPPAAREIVAPLQPQLVLDLLVSPDGRLGPNPVTARDKFLLETLKETTAALSKRFGENPSEWTYGGAHYKHARIRHPLSAAVNDETRETLETAPVPQGGYGYTVNNTSNSDNQTFGATFRVIIDLSDFDRSVGTNAPGQSGDPASSHYRDLYELWARGQYFPLLYSREKVEAIAQRHEHLHPQ